MQPEKVQKRSEVTIECEMFGAIDLSLDIPLTITEMDNEEESKDVEQRTELMAELTKALSFFERMKRLSPHQLPLKERMKDRTISYVDFLHLDPLLAKLEEDSMPRVSRRLALRKMKSKEE